MRRIANEWLAAALPDDSLRVILPQDTLDCIPSSPAHAIPGKPPLVNGESVLGRPHWIRPVAAGEVRRVPVVINLKTAKILGALSVFIHGSLRRRILLAVLMRHNCDSTSLQVSRPHLRNRRATRFRRSSRSNRRRNRLARFILSGLRGFWRCSRYFIGLGAFRRLCGRRTRQFRRRGLRPDGLNGDREYHDQ
jgi:hypothetical protein